MLKLFRRKAEAETVLRDALGDFTIPSFPQNVLDGLRALRDPEVGLSRAARVLCVDPGLSSQLLRRANAPSYGLGRTVKNVNHAVTLLGRSEVESIVLSVAVKRSLPQRAIVGFRPIRFWQTAFRRATIARALAAQLHPATASESFTAALLQDMAVPFLAHAKGASYGNLVEEWRTGGGELSKLEREAFGWDQSQIAESICRKWSFPEGLREAIAAHHDDNAQNHGVPAVVTLVARLRESEEPDIEELVTLTHETTGLPEEHIRNLVEKAFAEAEALYPSAPSSQGQWRKSSSASPCRRPVGVKPARK